MEVNNSPRDEYVEFMATDHSQIQSQRNYHHQYHFSGNTILLPNDLQQQKQRTNDLLQSIPQSTQDDQFPQELPVTETDDYTTTAVSSTSSPMPIPPRGESVFAHVISLRKQQEKYQKISDRIEEELIKEEVQSNLESLLKSHLSEEDVNELMEFKERLRKEFKRNEFMVYSFYDFIILQLWFMVYGLQFLIQQIQQIQNTIMKKMHVFKHLVAVVF